MRRFLRAFSPLIAALAVVAYLLPVPGARADFAFTAGTGLTGFSFTSTTGGTALCAAASTHCFASVPVNTAGAQLFTTAVPGVVSQATAASLNATVVGTGTFVTQSTLAAETTKVIGTINLSAAQTLATVTTVGTVTNLAQMNGAALLMGNGATGTGAQRITISNDNTIPTGWPSAANQTVVTTWGGGTIGAMANYGTSPGAVLVPGVNAFVTNVNANIGSNADGIATGASAGSPTVSYGLVYNGTTWDRMPGTTAGVTVRNPTAANLNATVVGAGSAGTANAGVVTVQGIASMTKLLVTPDSVALPANQSVNTAQFGGTTVVNGGTAGITGIGGSTATNVALTDNPINTGFQAISSQNAAVTPARKVQGVADLSGRQIITPYANPENWVQGTTSAMTGTTSTSLIQAPAAGLRNYAWVSCVNSHATVGTFVSIQDGSGGTILGTLAAAAVYGGQTMPAPIPIRQPTTATALFVANVTTGANVICTATGYTSTL